MLSTTLNDIQLAVFNRVKDAPGLLPIKYDDKKFDHNKEPFIELIISPMDTESETIDGGDLMSGFIQFNVYVPKDVGARWPAGEAQKCIDLFMRDDEVGPARIKRMGTVKAPYDNRDMWNVTPAVVEYEADSWQM